MRLGAVLMASGGASRFGRNKLLYPVDGVPMVQRALSAIPAAWFEKVNVVSCYPEILSLAEEYGYQPIPNRQAREGQSASIRLGLSPLSHLDGVLFAVCDQPYLSQASVVRLLEAFSANPDRICTLSWQGERKNPVIFPPALFPALLSLRGDQRGGAVIRAHRNLLHLVEADNPLELYDVDTPTNLRQLLQGKGDCNMKEVIATTKAPAAIGPYSQAIKAGGTLYISGQLPIDPATGEFASQDVSGQTRQSLENIGAILAEAGCDYGNVAKTTVLLADISDFAAMNAVYAEYFTRDCPARAAFAVKGLPKGALVEIEAIAVCDESR